jgi:hypothetical protein
MQNTMNTFNEKAKLLRQTAKTYEDQICKAIDAEKPEGKSFFRKSQELKDLTIELSNLCSDAKDELNTINQAKKFYENDMEDLLNYYTLKAIDEHQLQGQRTFKRNLNKLEKTLLEYINNDPYFENDENLRLSIYAGEYNVSVYAYVNKDLKLDTTISTTSNWQEPKKTYFQNWLTTPEIKPEILTADEYIAITKTIKTSRKEYFEKLNEFRKENNHLLDTYGRFCEFLGPESETFKVKTY